MREREEINHRDEASHPIRISGNNSDNMAHREEPCHNALWSQVPRAEVVPLRTGGEHAGQINGASLYFSNIVPYLLFFIPSVDTSLTSEFNSRAMCLC